MLQLRKRRKGLVGVLHIAPDTCEWLIRDLIRFGVIEPQTKEQIKIQAKYTDVRLRGIPYIVSHKTYFSVPYKEYVRIVALNFGREGDTVVFETSEDELTGLWDQARNIRPSS